MAEPSTRERILDVAAELFIEQGYDGTSLREIADRMGFTKAALYYHFPSKEKILEALLEPFLAIADEMRRRLTKADTIEEWADALAWTIDEALPHRWMFSLLDRNRGVVRALADDSDFFRDHEHWHEQIQATAMRLGRTFDERTRLVCTLGVIAGLDDFGGAELMASDPEQARALLKAISREILGLSKRRRGAPA